MPEFVGYLLLFLVVGVGFILVHLLVGKLIRPSKPHDEKLTIYECGEPTIGSAWVQFDVRFYVVALLFVIFDVEVAFFFPWAVVFGGLTNLAGGGLSDQQRLAAAYALETGPAAKKQELQQKQQALEQAKDPAKAAELKSIVGEIEQMDQAALKSQEPAKNLAWIAMLDIAVFFGVLLVGFAYLWRRGDVQWIRSTAAEQPEKAAPAQAAATSA